MRKHWLPAIVMGAVLSVPATYASALLIADFNTDQQVTYGPAGIGFTTDTVSDPMILGQYRDVTVRITSFINQATRGKVEAYSNIFNPSAFDTMLSNNTHGVVTVVWDGSSLFSGDTASGDFGTPAAFALNVDLTSGGSHDRLRLIATNDGQPRGDLRVRLWDTTGTVYADASAVFQGSNVWTAYELLFSNFAVTGAPTFNFASVGAIALQIDARSTSSGGVLAAGLDTTIDIFETAGPIPEPLTFGLSILSLGALGLFATQRRQV